jgi:hypothetical protein
LEAQDLALSAADDRVCDAFGLSRNTGVIKSWEAVLLPKAIGKDAVRRSIAVATIAALPRVEDRRHAAALQIRFPFWLMRVELQHRSISDWGGIYRRFAAGRLDVIPFSNWGNWEIK